MRASSVRANARAIVTSDGEPYQHPHTSLHPWVRERSAASTSHRAYQDHSERPAHPLDRLVAQLNESWRVVDDPLQWILQRRKGNPRPKNSGWRDRSFCRTRDALLRCVREYCGEIDVNSLSKLNVRRASRGRSLHLLFHLPVKYRMGARLLQVEEAIYRLIKKHGRRDDDKHGHGYWADEVIKLVIHDNPDGKYSSRVAVPKSGSTSASGRSIAAYRVSSSGSAAALRRTSVPLRALGRNSKTATME